MDRSGKTFGIIVLTIFTVILSLLFYRSEHREETTLMAALQPLKFLLVSPQTKHTATVIFVHVSCQGFDRISDQTLVQNSATDIF